MNTEADKQAAEEVLSIMAELDYGKSVGEESRKTWLDKRLPTVPNQSFFQRYMKGAGCDLGFAGYIPGVVPILPTAQGVDLTTPGYDGRTLPFADESLDYVYSSHFLEHVSASEDMIRQMHRVTKIGGYIIVVVPHQYLYEKKAELPSRWNEDHRRFYTPSSLLNEVESALQPNSYRVRLLEDGDKGFDYAIPPDRHSGGQYELTLVLEKMASPKWDIA